MTANYGVYAIVTCKSSAYTPSFQLQQALKILQKDES